MTDDKTREIRLRRAARRQGLVLTRSRRRDPHARDFGGHWLRDDETGETVLGDRWGVTLDEVEEFLNTDRSQR